MSAPFPRGLAWPTRRVRQARAACRADLCSQGRRRCPAGKECQRDDGLLMKLLDAFDNNQRPMLTFAIAAVVVVATLAACTVWPYWVQP